MSALQWKCMRWLENGERWPALLGLLVLFYAVLFGVAVLPAQHTLAHVRGDHDQLSRTIQQRQSTRATALSDTAQTSIVQQLPSYRSVPETLSRLFAHAKALDVVLDIGDYRYQRNKNELFGRYQIDLPVVTDYQTLRVFIARLANELPYTAIDDIQIVREDVGSDVVEARLRIVLFLKEQV